MRASTDFSPPVERFHGPALRRENEELRAENKYLRRRVRELTAGRDHWRSEARLWKWGALR